MEKILIVVLVICVLAFLLKRIKFENKPTEAPEIHKSPIALNDYSYQSLISLMSNAEKLFYNVLVQASDNRGDVFTKVRVADVLSPKAGMNRSDWQRAFNAISAKHFDFLICDPIDYSIKLVIELDDSSHGSSKVRKRDSLKDSACRSAGLPLLRIKASNEYDVNEMRRQIEKALS